MNEEPTNGANRVVIAGGGVAGLEALLALRDLAGDRTDLTLVAPQPDFLYKPLLVEEPFNLEPAERHELKPLAEEHGAHFVQAAVSGVRPEEHQVALDDGSTLDYDYLVVCAGGRYRPALEQATTFPSADQPFRADELLERAQEKSGRIAFVVPHGVVWSLPLYEIALMTQRRAVEKGLEAKPAIVSPEATPLAVFGPAASSAVAELLDARGIQFFGNSTARETSSKALRLTPGDRAIGSAEIVALPVMEGPSIGGLPSDEHGFIPIDEHARVKGVDDVYAAGDGTNFPIKQGGIGTQEADAAAEHIAHRVGASGTPKPFRPVLRGRLLTGDESVSLKGEVAGGRGGSEVSPDLLWWPPHKISARYLAPLLYHGDVHKEPEPPRHSLDVEVALPKEWHEEPMTVDPLEPPSVD